MGYTEKKAEAWGESVKKGIIAALLASFILLLLASGCTTEEEIPAASEQEYLDYHSTMIPVEEKLERSPFLKNDFSMDGEGFVRYVGEDYQALKVIDVSAHQGNIEWSKVAESGVEGVLIRAAYRGYGSVGNLKEDACFSQNIKGALRAGLKVGAYVYSQAITAEEAREEAQLVLSLTEGYTLELPIAFDWEHIDHTEARTDNIGLGELTDIAKAFLEEIRLAGRTPMVYFNQEMAYLQYDLSELVGYEFWLAEYGAYPKFYYNVRAWQYACILTMDGIKGAVDTNLYFTENT